MRTLAISLLTIAVLPAGRHAMAADSAASLIEAVSQAASSAGTWEADGRLATQESADDAAPRRASFRIVIGRVPAQRARIEITAVPAPVTRVCDGTFQRGYLPAASQFWARPDARIDACADPFNEWPYLAADLHDPVITGQEQLHIGDRVIDCTVVSGDYAGPDASRTGKRTLWIEDATKTVWQYRVERGATGPAGAAVPAVRTYTLQHQTRDAIQRPDDFALQVPDEVVKLPVPPSLRLGDGQPMRSVAAPVLIHKTEPQYTEAARHSHIEGTVILSVDVGPDGVPNIIRVIRSLDPGLDQKAIEAVSQWKFKPGVKDGVAVTVRAQIQVNFRLLDNPQRQ
ncbi:MAG: energy transducer TonB [Bryobacteraceae bacterium]